MTYDFSHLYKTKTLSLGKFQVVVQEISHGKFAEAQDEMLSKVDWDGEKDSVNKSMLAAVKAGKLSTNDMNDFRTIAGIQSWTLTDKNTGDIVPVCLEVYRLLPHVITEQIEKAIEELNPELDSTFQE